MANNYFQFKQFKIIQENSAMKVGTDGVLIGAWANVLNTNRILDVGAGTGLIALMLAQRTTAQVIGVEIEKKAAIEAMENVKNSPWRNRVLIKNISFQNFANSTKDKFDLIVSNPPFFANSVKNLDQNRTIARHNDTLPFVDLINGTVKLLKQNGRFSVILPVDSAAQFEELARLRGLYLNRQTKVKPDAVKNDNRFLMEFTQKKRQILNDNLIVYNQNHTDKTSEYKILTGDFYLNF